MRVTDQALRALTLAAEAARELGDKPGGYHMLLGLARAEGGARHVLGSSAGSLPGVPRPPAGGATAKEIVDEAIGHAYARGRDRATTADLLYAVLGPVDGPSASLVRAAGADPAMIRAALAEGDHGGCCQETGVSEIRVLLATMGSDVAGITGRGRAVAGLVGGSVPYLLLWFAVLAVTWDTAGPEPVLALAAATMLLSGVNGSMVVRRRTREAVARAATVLPVPGSVRPLLDRLGLRQLEVRVEAGPGAGRCHRLGRRAWIVLGDGVEQTPAIARFVLWHEMAHLARRDHRARRLHAGLGVGLIAGAIGSLDLRALTIAVAGTALVTVGGRWWSEAACDRLAVRRGGPAGLQAFEAAVRGYRAVLRRQRALPRWARVKGVLTHPPLALRVALNRPR